MKKINVLTLDCLKDFQCIGPACELSCCVGWRVDIDKETLKKYKKCKDGEWLQKFSSSIEISKEDEKINSFRTKENEECIFLGSDKLCTIQKRFGETYLSDVCYHFPRGYNMAANNRIEKIYFLSCPEVIRKALLNKERFDFVNIQEIFARTLNVRGIDKTNKYASDFKVLQKFTIDVLRCDTYSIEDRLIILTYFHDMLNSDDTIDVKNTIVSFEQIIQSRAIDEILEQIKPDKEIYYNYIQSIFVNVVGALNKNELGEYLNKVYSSLFFDKDNNFQHMDEKYHAILSKEYGYILENYLCYYVFSTLFPINDKDMNNNFFELVIRFNVVKFYLIGSLANEETKLDEKNFVRYLVLLFRRLDAGQLSIMQILSEQLNKHNIKYMFKFIKV